MKVAVVENDDDDTLADTRLTQVAQEEISLNSEYGSRIDIEITCTK